MRIENDYFLRSHTHNIFVRIRNVFLCKPNNKCDLFGIREHLRLSLDHHDFFSTCDKDSAKNSMTNTAFSVTIKYSQPNAHTHTHTTILIL